MPLDDKSSSHLSFVRLCAPSGQGQRGIYPCIFGGWHTADTQHVLDQYLQSEWSRICFKCSSLPIVAICALCMEAINKCWLFIMIMMTYGVFIFRGKSLQFNHFSLTILRIVFFHEAIPLILEINKNSSIWLTSYKCENLRENFLTLF